MPKYVMNGKTYNIPDSLVNKFESENPNATIAYSAGGKKYNIPVSKRERFLKAFPDASAGEEQKETAATQQPTEQPMERKGTANKEQPQTPSATKSQPSKDALTGKPISPYVTGEGAHQAFIGTPDFEASYEVGNGKRRKVSEDIQEARHNTKVTPAVQQYVDEKGNVVKENVITPVEPQEVAYDRYLRESRNAPSLERQNQQRLDEVNKKLAKSQERELRESANMYAQSPALFIANAINMAASPTAGANMMMANNETENRKHLEARQHLLSEGKRIIDEVKIESGEGDVGILGGLKQAARNVATSTFNKSTWDFGATDINTQTKLMEAIVRMDNGEAITEDERELLSDWAMNNAVSSQYGKQLSGWAKAGQVTGESLPFMLEMAINPASGMGQAAQKGLVKYAVQKYGKKWVKDHAKGVLASKIATRVVGDVLGGAVMAGTTGLVRTSADAAKRYTEGMVEDVDPQGNIIFKDKDQRVSPMEAFTKAWAANGIENSSEMWGEYLAPVTGVLRNAIGKAVVGKAGREALNLTGRLGDVSLNKAQRFIYDVTSQRGLGAISQGLDQFLKKTQWHGVFGEYVEEELGNLANAATVGDMTFDNAEDTGIFNLQQHIDTFAGVALMGGFMSALHTGAYAWDKWNNRMSKIDERGNKYFADWDDMKTVIQSVSDDPFALNSTITGYINSANMSKDEKKVILDYAGKVLERKGAEMAEYQPRMNRNTVTKNSDGSFSVTSFDAFDQEIGTQTFKTEDEAKAYQGELKMRQQSQDMKDYLQLSVGMSYPESADLIAEFLGEDPTPEQMADIQNPETEIGRQFQERKNQRVIDKARATREAIATFEETNGWEPGTIRELAESDPMELSDEELQMADQAREFLKGLAYPASEVHTEISEQEGTDTGEAVVENVISQDTPIDPLNNAGQQLQDQWNAAQQARNDLFARNEDMMQEVTMMEQQGLSPQEIASSLDTFSPEERQILIDYYNTQAKYNAMMLSAESKINEVAANERQRRTFHGTIDGAANLNDHIQITDGENVYTIASGDVTTDGNGTITGSASGLIIGVDLNGELVSLGDDTRMQIMPVTQTLDQWEEGRRNELQEGVTSVIDPNGTMGQQTGGIQSEGGGPEVRSGQTGSPTGADSEKGNTGVPKGGGGDSEGGQVSVDTSTIDNFWNQQSATSITVGGGQYEQATLTKPGTSPNTFNGQELSEITDPKGGKVTTKFYTEQGSEYVITENGMTRRIKSPNHSNTGGTDGGLHGWNSNSFFSSGEEGKNFNLAAGMLKEKGYTISIQIQGNRASILLYDPATKQWRLAKMSDAYTNAVNSGTIQEKDLTIEGSTTPELGSHILEFENDQNNVSHSVHPGSPVVYIEQQQTSTNQTPLTKEQAEQLLVQMQQGAEVAPELPLTPENWLSQFGEQGKVNSPIGEVTMGENQYFKLAQQGREGKLGMVKPTLENPDVIIEEERPAKDGNQERATSYIFVKAFTKADGSRYYYFTSVTVSKDGHEVVVSNQEKSVNRISRLLQQGNVTWINPKFSSHPIARVGESVPVNESNMLTSTDNQPALLGINSPELSGGKGTENSDTSQDLNVKVDKNGVKLYEEGTPIDDAIKDIQRDGYDPGQFADLAISEAQEELSKMKQPKSRAELVKNDARRKELQNIIDYYTNLKARFAELNREENVNVQPEQPEVQEKTVSSQPKVTVEEQKQERIKALKAELGELFDDDFTKANDVYELVSMWMGRKRNLAWDDVNGKRGLQKELGWTRKIGGDTKYIETLLAKKGEGMGVEEFVHMVWESPENDVNGEKCFSTEEIKEALLGLLKSAQSKSDVVDYALNTREAQARAAHEAEEQMRQEAEASGEAEIEPMTSEKISEMEANLPFPMPSSVGNIVEILDAIDELSSEEGTPELKLIDTDFMNDDEWYDLTSRLREGAFVGQEEIEETRNSVLADGLYIVEETGAITIYSDSQTAEEVKQKVEYIKNNYNGRSNEEETGELEAQDLQRPTEGTVAEAQGEDATNVHPGTVQRQELDREDGSRGQGESGAGLSDGRGRTETNGLQHGENQGRRETQNRGNEERTVVPEGSTGESQSSTEGQGSPESAVDEYLQPRDAEEEKIIADIDKKLQGEIFAQQFNVGAAKERYDKKRQAESYRATDMFSDDDTRQEEGQLFGFDEMPTDRTQEGVERRSKAEKDAWDAAKAKLEQLQSEQERNSRIRGALDNHRRQTSIETEEQPQSQSREDYLASHPLTEEQIMADAEATEDEKLNAIDFLRGEDDSAISRFYYDSIYERAQKKATDQIKEIAQRGKKPAKPAEPQQPQSKWQYNFHYDKNTKHVRIDRDDVSGPIPIGDGRWHLDANNLAEMRAILENPANNLGEIFKEVEASLHNAEVGEKLRNEENPTAAIEQAAQSFREEQKSKDQQDIDAALKEFSDFLDNAKGSSVLDKFMRKGLEGNDKAQANLLDAFTLTNEAQRKFLKDLLRLASKVGYAYIKSGIHDAQAWSKKMSDSIGQKLREVLGWDDAIVGEFVDEVWNQKYTVDGQRMRLSEHAERLKNNKGADTSVNVNKQEDNEPDNSLPLQQKPASELEGDSAEFQERQEKIKNLNLIVHDILRKIAIQGGEADFDYETLGRVSIKTMSGVKSLADRLGLKDISLTDLQELVETQIVQLAREIANMSNVTDEQKYNYIVQLYQKQPSLNARDNDRINKQQYSTPAPMAFLMGKFLSKGKKVESGLEPSAGNGMLTINLPKEKMHVNDIDEMRLSNLSKQGFGQVTSQDGLQPFGEKQYDVVVTNPPFGSVPSKTYDGLYEISGLEHQMAINALESMKGDGRAAIIIGGNTEYNQNGTIKGKDRAFLNYLYSHYNVVDVINCDGKALYSRQGTGYDVRIILINGRKEFNAKDFAPVQSKARAEQVKSYDELYKRVNDDILQNTVPSERQSGERDLSSDNNRQESGEGHEGDTSRRDNHADTQPVRGNGTKGSGQLAPSKDGGHGLQRSGSVDSQTESGTDTGGLGAVRGGTSANSSGQQVVQHAGQTSGANGGQRGATDSDGLGREPNTSGGGSRPSVEVRRGLGTEKVPYRQQSKNPYALQSQMPAEQAEVVKKALEEIGDVDQFLVRELGYSSVEDMYHGSLPPSEHGGLSAEQIDSVALAIHQMNQGNAFIIGDQTGVGKGRQGAALIRYGVKKGGNPVYVTQTKELFSDMYRDLHDIGSGELRPFIWSADDDAADITDSKGNVIYKRPTAKEQKRVAEYILKNGKLPPEYDYIITSYSMFSSGTMEYENGQKKPRNFGKKAVSSRATNGQSKRDAFERLAENSYVLMDESHNAGGEDSAISGYLQYITTRAKGVTFLSATFAKRPGNMPIYSLKTAISKAGVKVGELIDAVKRGGATFQEIMSKALTEAGQMIRRERDMTGVTIDWKGIEDEAVVQRQREQYDTVIGLFNDIIDFQRRYVDPIVNKKNDDAADEQGEVDHTPGTRDMGINNTPFASRTYNMVQQVLLSLKAEEAAKRAIEHLKAGRVPVIALANTNEGAADEAAGMGEDMEMPDLSVNLKKGLQGTLRITKKDAFGNSTNEMIPFDELSEAGQARYREIMDAIENASSGLSLSPIDVIKNELKKAGYRVDELTGRSKVFEYNEDGTVNRVARKKDNKRTAAKFNNGELDALVINRSAGTGISLHASAKNPIEGQKQRVMIVVQAQPDVNQEVQMRGRIDRTGQVLRGMYEYVVSQIPSEQRLLMMLKAKLRSLDANTTSSQKSKFNEMQVQDIINKYGDDIVIQYLSEHPDLAAKMIDPLKWNSKLGDSWESMPSETLIANAEKDGEAGKTASKVLGRMALLKVAEQEKMLQEISDLYQAEIDRLNEMGENDLEITEMPLRAKTLKKDVWEAGVEPGGKNPFADNSYVETVEMDVLRKPMKAEEVKKAQARLLGGKTWDEYKQGVMEKVDAWAEQKKAETTQTITERAEKKANAEKEKYAKGAKKAQEKNGMTDAEIEKNSQYQYNTFYKQEMEKLQNALDAIDKQKQVFVDALETFSTDGVYALPTDIYDLGQLTFEPSFGKVIDINIKEDNFSTTASTITFATLDGRRKITIPISGMVKQNNGEKQNIVPAIMSQTAQSRDGFFGRNLADMYKVLSQNLDNWDRLTSSATRKKGYIITGNLLKALTSLRSQGKGGKLISYTTDTGEIRQGILMSDQFDPGALTSKNPISSAKADLDDWEKDKKIVSADKEVTIKNDNYGWYKLKVPKSKKKGEKYFNDEVLLSLMDGQFEGSTQMTANFDSKNLDAVLKRLDELGVTVESSKEEQNDMNTGYSEDIENTDEEQKIIERAKSDGTYMKAPNGEDSNLTPEQWVRVRTKAFKKWFGDWEKGATPIRIVFAAASHGFSNFAKARTWAKANIARVYNNEETRGKGEISISGKAIEKFLSEDAVKKSENKDIHMSVLTVLPSVIREGYLAESHPDYKKVDGKRSKENGVNSGVTIHRVYGAVSIDNKVYRIKITLKEDRTQAVKTRAYSYEATKIELLDGQSATPVGVPRNSNNSILLAKLLKGIDKSYEKGEKIIDSSQIIDENGEPKVVYHGSPYGGIDIFDHTKGRSSGLKEFGSFFTDNVMVAGVYRDQREISVELDEHLDVEIKILEERLDSARNIREYDAINKELEKLRRSRRPRIYNVFLNIRNPKEFDAKGQDGWDGWHELKQDVGYDIKSGTEAIEAISGNNKAAIMDETYDGIIAHNIADIHSTDDVSEYLGDVFLVFKPNQIKSATENNGDYDNNNPNQGYSEGESAETLQRTQHKEKIRKHVENLLKKLGTRNRTTVITSINGVRNKERRQHIEDMHKRGRKVYGWFENGHIYLYLPDIDSIYKAEQTIWHETVAHVGLRELLGSENYGKLLNRLWMEHKDSEMGKWVTQRMQTNGWSLHKALDEWLAREAEKVVAERQERKTLWQKLSGWLGDMLREIGYRTNPTITDVRYLFWLSENQLREGEPISAIKRANFLYRLEREISASKPQSTQRSDMDSGYSEDIDDPLAYSAKAVYNERLNRVETVFSEAYQDAMVSLKTAQNAIAKDKDIPDSQNAYMAENLMHGKNKNEQDLFNRMFRDPLINTINKIMNLTGMNWGDVDRYVYTKSGLERNREFYVRDWLEKERKKTIKSYEDLNPEEQDIYNQMAENLQEMFEDGTIETEAELNKKLDKALQDAHKDYMDDVENEYLRIKNVRYADLRNNVITFPKYLEEIDKFIRENIDENYVASEHDYSGFRAMFGDEEGKYDEDEIISDLMDTEDQIEAENVDTLWEQIQNATRYGLERYREAGMRSDEQIDQIEQMFHWYVPMRGFKEDMGEDMYQYFTAKGTSKSYVGGLLKHAKGRGSEAEYPISTIFAMTYKAISDCNQNLVNQKLYRLCQANPNDLVILSDSWARLNETTGEWEEVGPDIPEDADEEDVRQATLAFEEEMRQLALEDKAKKIKGREKFDYKPMDKKKQSEHIVDVRINGQPRKIIVTGNPRMAQALNGQLRFERGKNVFSKWNAAIKNFMASVFTSYSPTFALRNMFRDWTHFRTMLGVREGQGYAKQANKYYRQSLFKMVGLFKKYREGTLNMDNEMERDFKDFMDNGGITGFVQMQKIDDIQKQMEKLYAQQKQGKTIRLNNKVWENTLGAIEALNEGIENNARFATYRASRHYAGRTKARSAYDAKEITVNFNRKGAGGKTAGFKSQNKAVEDAAKAFGVTSQILGEGRIFFNATVQAIATTFKNFQNADGSLNKKYIAKWAAKYALPPFMFGLALPMINKALAAAFGGDGDDDPYANLAEWTRRKNICLYVGGGNFITIPIGQELAAFLTLGDIVAGNTYAQNIKPVDRSWDDEILGVMNTFSPVDIDTKLTKGGLMEDPIDETIGRTFSVLAPLVAVQQNLGWTGRPIYREDKFQNDQYTPEYQMVYSGTNPVLVNASKLLHELGGGDDITRGKMEVNPAIIQYLWEQYTGGPGKVFSNTISIGKDAKDVLTGNESEFNIRKVEGLKAFVQQGDDRTQYYRTQAKYRKYKADAEKLYDAYSGYLNGAAENPEYLLKLEQMSKGEDFVRMQIVREADKSLSKINKAANKAEGKGRKELRKLYNQQTAEVVRLLDEVGKE